MMKLQAPARDVPADPAVLRLPPAALLVVAGVPGAGKTTLLSRIDAPGSLVLDPEPIRFRYQRLLGRTPYRLWRPLVHAEHFLRVVLALPGPWGLIVHDTGTRGWRRRLLAGLATAAAAPATCCSWTSRPRSPWRASGRRPPGPAPLRFVRHPLAALARAPAALPDPGEPVAVTPVHATAGLHAEGCVSVRVLDRPRRPPPPGRHPRR